MPLDVIMPALGMAQDAGRIVQWLKQPGDKVAEGDALFEVETDKATMEVEAQGAGYLTGVSAEAGQDVPVGQVIAQISDSPEMGAAPASAQAAAAHDTDALPRGTQVTMPQLGMAQDSGVLVAWCVSPGAQVDADDTLFEVETDKSTMEVPAGASGYLAAILASEGDAVPVGEVVAVLTDSAPDSPVIRSHPEAAAASAAPPAQTPAQDASPQPAPPATRPGRADARPVPGTAPQGRILASPKARRLALEQGLDLNLLVQAGHPQPYHVRDLDRLRALSAADAAPRPAPVDASRHLTALLPSEGFSAFADWAADMRGLSETALLAGLAAASLRDGDAPLTVAVERFGTRQHFTDPDLPALGRCAPQPEGAPDLIVRDLRLSTVATVRMGPEDAPVLTLTVQDGGLGLTLECAASHLSASRAAQSLSDFAGRLADPLRHLL